MISLIHRTIFVLKGFFGKKVTLMRYALRPYDYTLRIEIEGDLTFCDSRNFYRLLQEIKKDSTITEVIINLKKLYFMDSTGLALLMTAYDVAKLNHCQLVFEEPQTAILNMLAKATPYNALTIAA